MVVGYSYTTGKRISSQEQNAESCTNCSSTASARFPVLQAAFYLSSRKLSTANAEKCKDSSSTPCAAFIFWVFFNLKVTKSADAGCAGQLRGIPCWIPGGAVAAGLRWIICLACQVAGLSLQRNSSPRRLAQSTGSDCSFSRTRGRRPSD